MGRFFVGFLLMVSSGAVVAQDWAVRDADRMLTRDEVEQLTDGRTFVFYDNGRSQFSVGGAYSYTYASGESAFGRYRVEDDGSVCIDYRNGFSRCDRYVESGGRIVMLTAKGERFPIRPQEPK